MTREEIERAIPHRAPFLWLDEVLEITDSRLHARKRLDPADNIFTGHFPNFPVLPGVIQCEMAFQAAAVFIAQIGVIEAGQIPVVTRINNTRFKRMVRPGDTVDIEVELTERLSNAFFLTGRVTVDGQMAARLEFACTVAAAGTESD